MSLIPSIGIDAGVGLLGGITNLIASQQTADAIRRATDAAVAGQKQAAGTTQGAMDNIAQAFAPNVSAGNQATSQLLGLLSNYKAPTYNGPTSFSFDKFQDPASRTQMMLTQRGLDASSAASGGGGGASRALATEMANNANNAYQTALQSFQTQAGVGQQGFERGLQANQQQMGGLSGLSQMGLSATGQQQGLRTGLANNLASIQSGIGNTQGAGIMGAGMANAKGITGMAGGLMSGLSALGNGIAGMGGDSQNLATNPLWANVQP